MDMYSILEQNAKFLGVEGCLTQCMEECAELIKACNKMLRVSGIGQPTTLEPGEALGQLMEETIDVSICMAALSYLLCFDKTVVDATMCEKIIRTNNRYYKKGDGNDKN